MSLTQVGKALRAMKLSQETCLLRSLEPTGDRLALVCVNIEFLAAAAFCESPARELFLFLAFISIFLPYAGILLLIYRFFFLFRFLRSFLPGPEDPEYGSQGAFFVLS